MSVSEFFAFSCVLLVVLSPLIYSLANYFDQKALTEMRNRGDKTWIERWREKRKLK